jgi:exopolyphosphatase
LAPGFNRDSRKALNLKAPHLPDAGVDGLNQMLREAHRMIGSDARHHVVMGNESADLDSMISALMYAYWLHRSGPISYALIIPMMNIPRVDFKLRKDAVYLFRETGVDTTRLCFRDEIDLAGLHDQKKLSLSLLDHHHLAESQTHLSDAVVEIIDHHPPTSRIPDGVRHQIEPVGSSATLVAEKIIANRPGLLDARLSGLLFSTILIDTVKLDTRQKKVTPKDREIALSLHQKCRVDIDSRFNRLADLKSDISGLGADQILRKDFKALRLGQKICGISTVPLNLANWMKGPYDGRMSISDFARRRGLDLFLVMLYQLKPRFKRQLAAYAEDKTLIERAITFLTLHRIELIPVSCGGLAESPPAHMRCFDQSDPRISRKIILKALHSSFHNVDHQS